jgi:predicted ArsR family transcriptional regulator
VLDALRTTREPARIDVIVAATGLHANTVREHLDALVDLGLAARSTAEPSGRGRPAWLYEATEVNQGSFSEYAGLAAALARSIHERSRTPVEDALVAGRDWGRDLAKARHREGKLSETAARREVVELFDDMGFGCESDARARSVRLTRCPLLETARQYPDVVCGVHLGLAQGALESYGADPDGAELLPFAEPGACRLHLAGRRS